MKTTKTQKTYTDYGLGFPVQISNAPLRRIRDEWILDINFEKYEKAVLIALSFKESRLTGNEIKFIRNYFEMTLKAFGIRFGNLAHSAVIKWEKFGDDSTNMNWPTEKDIRIFILRNLKPTLIVSVYDRLESVASSKHARIKIDTNDLMAA